MDTLILLLRLAALTGMFTAVGVTAVQMFRLRSEHKPKIFKALITISTLGSIVLVENLLVNLFSLADLWLTFTANLFFIALAVILISVANGAYRQELADRVAEEIERQLLKRMDDGQ